MAAETLNPDSKIAKIHMYIKLNNIEGERMNKIIEKYNKKYKINKLSNLSSLVF